MAARSLSRLFRNEDELSSEAKHPSEYSMLKHESNELTLIPIDPNLLFFYDKASQLRYFKMLYINEATNSVSKEFANNILNFYIFITIYFLINLGVVILLYSNNTVSSNFFHFHLSSIIIILFLSYLILYCIYKFNKFIYKNRQFYILLGFIIYSYMIIGNSQVLSNICNDPQHTDLMPLSIGIIGFTYPYRRILFDSHRYIMFTIIPVLVLYLALNLIYSNHYIYSILGEFCVIGLFLVTQAIECHYVENRTIQLFYRMEKEIESFTDINAINDITNSQTDAGLYPSSMISKCEFIIKELKHISSRIIYKDIKDRLKIVQTEAKNIIGGLMKFNSTIKFDLPSSDIDEQDRQFISQNYLNASTTGIKLISSKNTLPMDIRRGSHAAIPKSLLNEINDKMIKIGSE